MTDGYEVYNGIAHVHRLVHLGCWAHADATFVEAEAVLAEESRVALSSWRRSSLPPSAGCMPWRVERHGN